jgi:glycosyltransferase involved in cell wall biosynthesis
MTPRVSVIIPCYNSTAYVADAVRSALAQDYPSVRVIVVNDGSTDDFAGVIAPFRDRIEVIDQENRGLPAARNRGIDDSESEYIAYLDADDEWAPTKLSREVEFLESHPGHALVHTRVCYIDHTGAVLDLPERRDPAQGEAWQQLADRNSIIVSSVMHRRSVLGDHRFEPSLRACEDWDLWLRLARRGPVGFLPEVLTAYRLHGLNMSKQAERMAVAGLTVVKRARHWAPDLAAQHVLTRHERRLTRELANALYEQRRYVEARPLFQEVWRDLPMKERLRLAVTALPPALAREGRNWANALRRGSLMARRESSSAAH